MTIVAHAHPFVIGVDTHARTHTLAVLVAATGELVATEQFPATDAGMDRAVAWAACRTDGELSTLWVIEGVATYGAHLASAVKRAGFEVVEAAAMDARVHRGTGKSDPLDARRTAAAVLPLEHEQLRRPRSDVADFGTPCSVASSNDGVSIFCGTASAVAVVLKIKRSVKLVRPLFHTSKRSANSSDK
jgi:hypothetical protein